MQDCRFIQLSCTRYIKEVLHRTTHTPHAASLLFVLFIICIIDKSARSDQLLHEFWKRLSLEFSAFRPVIDLTAVKIHFNLVSCLDPLCRLRALNDREPDKIGRASCRERV